MDHEDDHSTMVAREAALVARHVSGVAFAGVEGDAFSSALERILALPETVYRHRHRSDDGDDDGDGDDDDDDDDDEEEEEDGSG